MLCGSVACPLLARTLCLGCAGAPPAAPLAGAWLVAPPCIGFELPCHSYKKSTTVHISRQHVFALIIIIVKIEKESRT